MPMLVARVERTLAIDGVYIHVHPHLPFSVCLILTLGIDNAPQQSKTCL